MKSEEPLQSGSDGAASLVSRFEQMLLHNESYYFDLDECEDMLEFYLDRNDTQSALQVIQHAKELFPDSTITMLREAQILAGNGKTSEAIKILKKLEILEEGNEEIHITLATIYSQLRKHELALGHYQKALELVDEDQMIDIYLDIALEFENMSDHLSAIETLKKSLALFPDHEIMLYEIAFCYDAIGKTEEGIKYLQSLIDEDPYNFVAWHILGNFYMGQGKFKEAIQAYDYCLAIEPDYLAGHVNKASAYVEMEEYAAAIEAFKEIDTKELPDASVFCFIAECYEKLGLYDEATDHYWESLSIDDTFIDAYIGLAIVSKLKNEHQDALDWMQKALSYSPGNAEIQIQVADCLYRAGYDFEAMSMYKVILEKDQSNTTAWIELSDILAESHNLEDALDLLAEGAKKNPECEMFALRKVAYLHREGDRSACFDYAKEIIKQGFRDWDALFAYYPALELDPEFTQIIECRN